jgi:hypothetical protein
MYIIHMHRIYNILYIYVFVHFHGLTNPSVEVQASRAIFDLVIIDFTDEPIEGSAGFAAQKLLFWW